MSIFYALNYIRPPIIRPFMADDAQNKESMKDALTALTQIIESTTTPKTSKKAIADIIADLNSTEYPMSVRAANAISLLDDITQDPNMPTYVRTPLWHAVTKLESIRE